MKDLPCFHFCIQSISFGGDWTHLLCVSPFLTWPPWAALAARTFCVQREKLSSAHKSLPDLALLNRGSTCN